MPVFLDVIEFSDFDMVGRGLFGVELFEVKEGVVFKRDLLVFVFVIGEVEFGEGLGEGEVLVLGEVSFEHVLRMSVGEMGKNKIL